MTREQVYAAHVAVHGARPEVAVDHPARTAWQRSFDGDITRVLRAGLLLTADGTLGVPAGRTVNVGARGPRGLGAAGQVDDGPQGDYLGIKFGKVEAATLAKLLGRLWDPEALCDRMRAIGYRSEAATDEDVQAERDHAGDPGLGVSWKRIVDPKPLTPRERLCAAALASIEAMIDGLIADETLPAAVRDTSIAKRFAAWQKDHPEAPAPVPAAVPAMVGAAARAETEAAPASRPPPTVPSARQPAPPAPPVPPAELTTAPEGRPRPPRRKREKALRAWRAEHAPAA